ncbi:MAG: RNA methyltransferase [Balneolaceae bacterium]|nr:RNA methyltransferase [Balneolaceae bacterium]
MNQAQKKQLVEYLADFATDERIDRINEVLENRTRHLTVVLEDVYQPHNASAVLRSCECFGIQDVHIIENRNRFDPSTGVAVGADQWLTLHRYDGDPGVADPDGIAARCFESLRSDGYAIVAMTPHREEATVGELPVENKTALLFGTELEGLSEYAMEHADRHASIPMYGFSESFNISVSTALALYEVVSRLRESDVDWRLSSEERMELRIDWLRQSIRAGEELARKFLEGSGSQR